MEEIISKSLGSRRHLSDRQRIDQQFEEMANDEEYFKEMLEVDAAWSAGSDEALRIHLAEFGEKDKY